MQEEINLYVEAAEEAMQKAIAHTESAFSKIRAGKASPLMVKGVMVEYYGALTPLDQVANVTAPDARTIAIKPWEKGVINNIERAIINGDTGFNPQNDGETIRINVPALTEDRRKDLVKQAKGEAENGKVGLRGARQSANADLKQLQKDGAPEDAIKDAETTVQTLTDTYSKKIDAIFSKKEEEIMTL